MKDKIEELALKAFLGVNLAVIISLASVQLWVISRAARLEMEKNKNGQT